MSASAQTIIGSLPPSSRVQGTRFRPQASATLRPVATLPVKEILSTPASTRAAPVSPSPTTRLKTPSGSPAAAKISSTRLPEKGVTSEGFSTTALPAISAWAVGFREP